MKRIYSLCKGFVLKQEIFVMDSDNNVLESVKAPVNQFAETVLALAQKYDIADVALYGSDNYLKGIVHKIQMQEMKQYNQNKLNIVINNRKDN